MYGYNPYYSQYNGYQSAFGNQNQLIRVTGLEGAKAYQMAAPNSSVALFDSNSDAFFLKTTDGGGFPTIRSFRFEEIKEDNKQVDKYVTRQEFDELKGMILNGKQSVRKPAKQNDTSVSSSEDQE